MQMQTITVQRGYVETAIQLAADTLLSDLGAVLANNADYKAAVCNIETAHGAKVIVLRSNEELSQKSAHANLVRAA